jgi:predicted RNA-binding protein YlxR (DUF448 family)
MATAQTTVREDQADSMRENTRRCLATGAVRPKHELIRFVVAPDNVIIPDFTHKLPGRGLWVTATHDAIDDAARKNLFARMAKSPVKVDPELADNVAQLLHRRCLDLIGFARSAGIAVLGHAQVETAMKSRLLSLLLVAEDAAANGLDKIGRVPFAVARAFSRDELGGALGQEQTVYVGFKAHGLTEKLHNELARLEKVTGKPHLIQANG